MEYNIKKVPQKYIDLIEIDNEEQIVCMIKRHYVGLFGVLATGLATAFIIIFGTVFFGSWTDSQDYISTSQPVGLLIGVAGVLMGLLVGFLTFVAGYVYSNSVILVTSDKIAQILYRNLVDRKISQLALGDLQDVTVDQKGLLARLFGYGTLVIETAGEQNNFSFNFTPHPYTFAKEIVGVREESIKKYGN